jgi:hypothetical protein
MRHPRYLNRVLKISTFPIPMDELEIYFKSRILLKDKYRMKFYVNWDDLSTLYKEDVQLMARYVANLSMPEYTISVLGIPEHLESKFYEEIGRSRNATPHFNLFVELGKSEIKELIDQRKVEA